MTISNKALPCRGARALLEFMEFEESYKSEMLAALSDGAAIYEMETKRGIPISRAVVDVAYQFIEDSPEFEVVLNPDSGASEGFTGACEDALNSIMRDRGSLRYLNRKVAQSVVDEITENLEVFMSSEDVEKLFKGGLVFPLSVKEVA